MKNLVFLILFLLCFDLFAQQGYVRLSPDSLITGYLRHYVSASGAESGWEVWKTKNDKHPTRIPITRIHEYAIRKDTFRILHQYQPLGDERAYFEFIELKRKESGKINLYSMAVVPTYGSKDPVTGHVYAPTFRQDFPHNVLYILEHRQTGYLEALPPEGEKLIRTLFQFFPQRFVTKYAEVNGKIRYGEIPKMVALYNSK